MRIQMGFISFYIFRTKLNLCNCFFSVEAPHSVNCIKSLFWLQSQLNNNNFTNHNSQPCLRFALRIVMIIIIIIIIIFIDLFQKQTT